MNLEEFFVSTKYGFLLQQPLERLPDYFEPWNYMADHMMDFVKSRKIRDEVSKIPLLDYNRLTGHRQLRLARLQLSVIAACYVWQDGDKGVPKQLPAVIAIPLVRISDLLGVEPIVAHVDVALANYKIIDPQKPLELGNIQCICHLPGGDEADWFFRTTIQTEIDFIPAVQAIVDALEAVAEEKIIKLACALDVISSVLRNIKTTLTKMHDGLSADTFYNVTRPFLSGWGGNGSPLPDGLIYEGVDNEPKQMAGGSAAQSSCLQSVDALLGVSHENDVRHFFDRMLRHMPTHHRRFIEVISERSRVREYVSSRGDPSLTEAYNECIQALVDLRSYHIQIVTNPQKHTREMSKTQSNQETLSFLDRYPKYRGDFKLTITDARGHGLAVLNRYIVIMSNRQNQNNSYEAVSKKGTGGSSILPFLRSSRTETTSTKVLDS